MESLIRKRLANNLVPIFSELKNCTIFLTGGTGFFGKSYLDFITYLNTEFALNIQTTVLTRDRNKFEKTFPEFFSNKHITFLEGDICTFKFPENNYDYILHFATPASATMNRDNPIEMFEIIYNGQIRVLEFAKATKVKSILFASSGAVYGRQPSDLTHIPESFSGAPLTNDPNASYGEAKRASEVIGNFYSDKYDFNHKIARCFTFYGPYLDTNGTYAFGNFIKNIINNEDVVINGSGEDFRSYLYSDDLITALLLILIKGENKKPYNVGSEDRLKIKDLAQKMIQVANSESKLIIKGQKSQGLNSTSYVPSIKQLKEELKYIPSTNLEEGINETIKYLSKAIK